MATPIVRSEPTLDKELQAPPRRHPHDVDFIHTQLARTTDAAREQSASRAVALAAVPALRIAPVLPG